jgi:hypothetical protein
LALCWFAFRANSVPVRNLSTPNPTEGRARIVGTVIWEGHELTGTTLYLYSDASLKDLQGGSPLLSDSGAFELRVAPGTYYLVAVVDRNRSGVFDNGDALGVYGIRQWGNPRERKIPITVGDRQKAVDVNLYISAIRTVEDDRSRIVGVEESDIPPAESAARTGVVRGHVTSVDGKPLVGRSAYVMAYADPSWRRRIASAKIADDGSYELSVPAGRYYLSAIVDANASNLFDEGDTFGVFGVAPSAKPDDLRRTPVPLSVRGNDVRDKADILLTVRHSPEGKLVPILGGAEPESEKPVEIALKGRVEWEGATLNTVTVDLYDDPSLVRPLAQTLTDPNGRFEFRVPAGDYFLVAAVDRNGDGNLNAGDGVGGYGADDIVTQPLRRYELKPDAPEAVVRVSAVYDDAGQLIRMTEEDGESASVKRTPATGIIGRVLWDGFTPKFAWLLLATSPDFADAKMTPTLLDRDGNFVLSTEPGIYYLTAIVETTDDAKMGIGDGVAVYGTRNPISGVPSPVLVVEGRLTPFISLDVSAVVTDAGGGYALLDDGRRAAIRAQFGEPNSRVRRHEGDRLIEEWWYWTLGLTFTFAADGPGWQFLDADTFKPNADALNGLRPEDLDLTPSFIAQSTVDARVYYVADGLIWALEADGSRQPVAYGSDPLATPRGLLYRNEDGDYVALDGATGEAEMVVERGVSLREMASSHDGTMLAYVRASDAGPQLRLRRWATREELIVPTDMTAISHPSWNRDASLVAFAGTRRPASADLTNPTALPPSPTSDIYVYDPAANRFVPLISETTDEGEPVWSPTDTRSLAFTRDEGGVRQVWLATFGENDEKTLRQLSHFGGEQPAWLPDGKGIVFVTNGQLWTVDLESGNERPLLVNREPVIGGQPAVQAIPPERSRLVGRE